MMATPCDGLNGPSGKPNPVRLVNTAAPKNSPLRALTLSHSNTPTPPLRRLPVPGDAATPFDSAPVSLWLEAHSGLKALLDEWRAAGVPDLRAHPNAQRSRIEACIDRIRIVRVNRWTLSLFEVDDLPHLVANLGRIFRDDMLVNFVDELVQLWEGKGGFVGNGVNYSLSGRRIDIQLRGAVLPGCQESWSRVLVALEDVSERESARRLLALSEHYQR